MPLHVTAETRIFMIALPMAITVTGDLRYAFVYLLVVMILPIVLDDATFGTLSSIILYNNVEILQALASDPGFFQNLFSKMRAADREGQDWANLVEFVRELCDHTNHLQVHQRHQFFEKPHGLAPLALARHGLGEAGMKYG